MLITATKSLLTLSLFLLNVEVTTLDGQNKSGKLESLTSEAATLQTADQEESIPLESLLEVKNSDAVPPDVVSPFQVLLRDDSVIPADSVIATAKEIQCSAAVPGDCAIPRSTVRGLRLQEENEEWTPAWNAFLDRENEQDLLIVVKRDGSGLDFLGGVVSTVDAEQVVFLLDGDEIPVPRQRVFGVVFPADGENEELNGDISVLLSGNAKLSFASLELSAGIEELRGETSWGQELELPLSAVSSIDFSSGRLHYLSDLEPITERYFGLDPPGKEWGDLFDDDSDTRTGYSSLWRMSRDRFPHNGRPQLSLGGKTYTKGLCIFPKALIEYALDEQYTKLTAFVGVDDDVAFNQRKGHPPTAVELLIEADGDEVFRKIVKATDTAIPLDLDVSGVATLSISVDFGDNDSTCDFLDLAEARLIVDTSNK